MGHGKHDKSNLCCQSHWFQQGISGDFLFVRKRACVAHDYPPSLIFKVDETGLTVVQKKQPKILALKSTRQIGALTAA
jgi:hypothetical protein